MTRKYQDGDKVEFQPTDPINASNHAQMIGATGIVEGADRRNSEFAMWRYRIRLAAGGCFIDVNECDLARAA